jgi:hypothetical protein
LRQLDVGGAQNRMEVHRKMTQIAERKDLRPLAQVALEKGKSREVALREAMRDRTAVQQSGRWFVRQQATESRDET